MNGLLKREKFSAVQLFTFTHAAHTSLLKEAKFKSVRT